MKKKIGFTLLSFVLVFTCFIGSVSASEYIILNGIKAFKDSPSGSRITTVGDNGYLQTHDKVIVLDKNYPSGNGCQSAWYKVRYNGVEGFICSSNQVVREEVDVDLNGEFEKQMLEKGFPTSYLPYLKSLHEKHPNWTFTRLDTGLDWDNVIANETIGEMSLVNGSDETLRKKDDYGNDIPSQNEAGWYLASTSTVAYYMDPRNFLTEEYVFMFENLHYNKDIQTESSVKGVISGTFLDTNEYLQYFMKAANETGASPVYLASRVRQEKGTSGGTGTDGGSFHFGIDQNCLRNFGYSDSSSWNAKNNCGTDETYSGIYNFYNIGAYGSYQSPVTRGLVWAMGGFDSSVTSYNRPWNTKEKAILGGASYIVDGYINAYQDTLYFQRFNVNPKANSYNPTYTHQYMTNIRAHASESYSMYAGYKDNNLLNTAYEFVIPTYQNMPNAGSEITPDVPDTPEEVPVLGLGEGITSSGYRLNNSYLSNLSFGKSIASFESDLKSVSSAFRVNKFQNKYNEEKSGTIGTGDKITITNGKDTKTYTAILYGDNNGDGTISILDLLRVQKYLLGSGNLTEAETIASDTNQDGLVNVVDLLRIQKHILGNIQISQ